MNEAGKRVGVAVHTAIVVATLVTLSLPARAQETPVTGEQLQQSLQNQQATNEALKARIDKLQRLLNGNVCSDVAAAETLLKETVPAPK